MPSIARSLLSRLPLSVTSRALTRHSLARPSSASHTLPIAHTQRTLTTLTQATRASTHAVHRSAVLPLLCTPSRLLSTTAAVRHSHDPPPSPDAIDVHVTFITPSGERVAVVGKEGVNLLSLAHANNVELEGACEAALACSTCHVILPDAYYRKLEPPVDEENDMLDMAFGLTDTSRLGCQVKLSRELEGMEIELPSATRNMAVDGHKPKPH